VLSSSYNPRSCTTIAAQLRGRSRKGYLVVDSNRKSLFLVFQSFFNSCCLHISLGKSLTFYISSRRLHVWLQGRRNLCVDSESSQKRGVHVKSWVISDAACDIFSAPYDRIRLWLSSQYSTLACHQSPRVLRLLGREEIAASIITYSSYMLHRSLHIFFLQLSSGGVLICCNCHSHLIKYVAVLIAKPTCRPGPAWQCS
jgi:hypothetical protein